MATYARAGDDWPTLQLWYDDIGTPMDLHSARVSYVFMPDSKRAKRREGDLRIIDRGRGLVKLPRLRTSGRFLVTVHFDGGVVLSPPACRVEP